MGFDEAFLMLVGSVLGYVIGTLRSKKYYRIQGFFDGWIARHRGQGIPANYADIYAYDGYYFFAVSGRKGVTEKPR